MKHLQARGLDRRRVKQVVSRAAHESSIGGRMEILSRQFLGRPYKSNPLIGSAETPEVFSASLDAFDCVTYIETVLALARASNVDEFLERLRKIRYERGLIEWRRRNHYMTAWIRNNIRSGILRPVPMPRVPVVSRVRVLDVVPGLPPYRSRIKCVPKRASAQLEAHLSSGDLLFFASTRRNLDVFHAGIAMRNGETILMRHASRSRGGVVEQLLSDFMKSNRMAGVMAVRPR
jgi:hypothetical protein